MLDVNLSRKDHIKTVENNLAENFGLLYRMKQFLDETSLKTIHFSYIHSYLNQAKIAWASIHCTKLKATSYKQKQAACIVFDKDWFWHSRPIIIK